MDSFRRGELTFDVLDSGPADGPVVVLLHGFPQFADSWRRVSELLVSHGYRCVAPNQRGYSPGAQPTRRRDYRAGELAADVLALIDELGADRVHLVGHDWGAAVAWAFALQHPDRVASLTAVSVPHPGAFLHALTHSRQFVASWYMYFFQLPYLPELVLTGPAGRNPRMMTRFLSRYGQSTAAAQRDTTHLIDRSALRTALNWYRAMALADRRAATAKARVPTLFVWSEGDAAVLRSTAEGCERFVDAPYRFEVLPGVSHWIPDEAPEDLARLLLAHVEAYPIG